MGLCLCGEEFEDRRQFRQVPFPNGGRDRDQMPPTFHHPHFRQVAAQNYEQNEPFDPRSPHGSKTISGESTRMSGSHFYQNGGSSIRREPGQTPGQRPLQQQQQQQQHPGVDYGNAPIDMQRTEVYRQGNDKQTAILKTPRGNTGRGGTPRTGGKSAGRGGGNTTPRTGNDPYGGGGGGDDDDSCYDGDDEMILICADCYCDVMDERCPAQCAVTGKMHV